MGYCGDRINVCMTSGWYSCLLRTDLLCAEHDVCSVSGGNLFYSIYVCRYIYRYVYQQSGYLRFCLVFQLSISEMCEENCININEYIF